MFSQNLERRFGITAVQKGFITAEQLIEAMSTQINEELARSDHNHRLVSDILIEKEYLTDEQVKAVLTSLGLSEELLIRIQMAAEPVAQQNRTGKLYISKKSIPIVEGSR